MVGKNATLTDRTQMITGDMRWLCRGALALELCRYHQSAKAQRPKHLETSGGTLVENGSSRLKVNIATKAYFTILSGYSCYFCLDLCFNKFYQSMVTLCSLAELHLLKNLQHATLLGV